MAYMSVSFHAKASTAVAVNQGESAQWLSLDGDDAHVAIFAPSNPADRLEFVRTLAQETAAWHARLMLERPSAATEIGNGG